MMRLLFIVVLANALCAGEEQWRQSAFSEGSEGWSVWAARPEIAPRTFVEKMVNRGEPGSLAISGNSNVAAYGGWERKLTVSPGSWYRLTAYYRVVGMTHENLQVLARLDWRTSQGKRAGQPDYAWRVRPADGGWNRVEMEAPAPENAATAQLQLYLQNAPLATVYWDEIALEPVARPGARKVTVAAVNLRPRSTGGAEASVQKFLDLVERQVRPGTDVILLPEGITVVGTGKTYAEVAETIPGPTTGKLGAMAKRKNAYIAGGILEREGIAIYNTAVLLDRQGQLVGKYRKVYLPREEIEGGLTPGNDYPVFDTDFGRVGMMICWDLQYADPARALARRGAELLLVPIWGGDETLGKARALENRVFVASSGYDYPTYVMDPDGEILAITREDGATAVATIDLNRRYADKWLGDMRGRFMKELRTDIKAEP
ncbi:MAG: carbon-nitrogen hydrolase family protein [Acidobacteriia bacterium]|nr:carbon-nitrogen hydrolase family protein [Terriglobia bacterium]